MPEFDVTWLSIIVSAVAYFALGAAWYMAFATPWMGAVGKTKEQIKEDERAWIYPLQMLATFALVVLISYLLVNVFKVDGVGEGISAGLVLWLIAVLASSGDFLYEGRNRTLFLINSGYRLAGFVLTSAIVSAWN